MGRSILGEPGHVTEERVTASDDGLTETSQGGDLRVACRIYAINSYCAKAHKVFKCAVASKLVKSKEEVF